MSFVVEDGSGLANANSYASVAEADTYHSNHGNPSAWTNATTAEKEASLRLATQALDVDNASRWRGRRAFESQGLDWPRVGVVDEDEFIVSTTVVPREVKDATAYLALASINGDTLIPDETEAPVESELVKVGSITIDTEFAGSNPSRKRYPLARKLLRPFVDVSGVNRG